MAANDHVFSSNSERSNYHKLCRQWGSRYRLYHNLPFLNVFNTKGLVNAKKYTGLASLLDPNEPSKLTIGDVDYNRLKKTSIDYTLCDNTDKPLLCIEFDGMLDGYNVGTEYRHDGCPDPWRELITSLKLRVAHGSMFPYFVVGYDHFKDLPGKVKLMMVDGIVGEVLSNLEREERIASGFDPEEVGYPKQDFERLPPGEQHELIQDWVIGIEVEAELKHNPISRRVCELEREVGYICSITWLSHPDPDQAKTLPERGRILENAIRKGCRCSLHEGRELTGSASRYHPSKHGPVCVTVWLPNFRVPGCTSVIGLAENLSKLVALEKARELIGPTTSLPN